MTPDPFEFDAAVTAPFRMQPGLRRLAPGARQLTPLAPGSAHQREKLAVLSAFPALALQAVPGFDAQPALRALAAHAAAEHPGHFAWDGAAAQALGVAVTDGVVAQQSAGRFGLGDEVAHCLGNLPPTWRLPGLLSLAFAEDFAIVDTQRGTLPWLAVALPSHWAPEEKIGLHFTHVHAPVADNALLLKAADALMRMVGGPERWERFVWNVTSHPRLHAHPRHVDGDRWPGAAFDPAGAWWRSERQTFIPLPALQQAVFTIAVQVQPLARAVDTPARAALLFEAVASMSPAVLAYRSLAPARDRLLAWLARRAAA
jgi:dimethylamine monooxygenase subunit A